MSDDNRPREFWVREATRDKDRLCCNYEPEPHGDEKFVRVIEYNAYQALEEKIKALEQERLAYRTLSSLMSDNEEMLNLYDDNEKLEQTNKELIEALEKIADPRKRDHREPDKYTEVGCMIHIAEEALAKAGVK